MTHRDLRPDTQVVASARPAREQGQPVNPPVVLSSTYFSRGIPGSEKMYARYDTETWNPFEKALGELESAKHPAILFGSGMAAVDAACALIPRGGHLVMPTHAYQVGMTLTTEAEQRGDYSISHVNIDDTDAVKSAITSETSMVWIESPTNPMLEVADISALCEAAHAVGALVVVDNTFASPLVQRPLEFSADIVLHSVTKYLAGHSDVVLGALVTSDDELRDRLHSYRTVHGAIAGPWEAWLALRGMRTLALRVERAQANAADLARRLQDHPAVLAVRHPSLPNDPGHALASRQMHGFGGVLCFEPVGGAEGADALIERLELWLPGTSLGGVESSLERRRRFATESLDVPEGLIRASVGIENVEDLWADLLQGLNSLR